MKEEDIGYPPPQLSANEVIGKVIQNRGNTFDVEVPSSHLEKVNNILGDVQQPLLVSLNPKLRRKFFVRRNGYVLLSLEELGPNGKIKGEIANIVADPKLWTKLLDEWPIEFTTMKEDNSMDLPPSLSDEDEFESE